MALDVYVGTLTRFYAQQWENVIQKGARERGDNYLAVSPQTMKGDGDSNPHQVEVGIRDWRRNVSEALCGAGGREIMWQEGMEPPCFTDRIGWEPLFAVRLWTSCIELGKTPPIVVPQDMAADPALNQCLADSAKYELTAFVSAQFWLPADFIFFAKFPSPTGEEVGVASIDALLFALEKINEQSWRTQEWRAWLKDDFPDRSVLEAPAKYGFAVLASMAVEAKTNRLPMVLSF